MKCSDYLWARYDMMKKFPDYSPVRVDGEMSLILDENNDFIESNTDGAKLSQREANSILGRNQDKLLEAYHLGRKSLFELVCTQQQISDDEWEKGKALDEEAVSARIASAKVSG